MERAGHDLYWWRYLVTALSFTVFGLGGALLGLTAVPLAYGLPGSHSTRRERARCVVRAAFRGFVGLMSGLGVLTYEFRGRERLGRPGQLVIANHPSLIDVVFLIAFTPRAGCVVKRPLWRNAATAAGVRLAGYVPNAPTDEMVLRAATALRDGQTMIMFPEGTRTKPGQEMRFHRGAAAVAVRGATVITPVFITVHPTTLTKGEPWLRIPPRRPHFSLVVGDDIHPVHFTASMPPPLASRTLNDHLLYIYSRADAAG